ncbi:MAG: hypothetical protein KOO63_07915 [Bacteroidales bacterium]|nr:hypothetical protein [Candidatus Latescibacterota bacterium]
MLKITSKLVNKIRFWDAVTVEIPTSYDCCIVTPMGTVDAIHCHGFTAAHTLRSYASQKLNKCAWVQPSALDADIIAQTEAYAHA